VGASFFKDTKYKMQVERCAREDEKIDDRRQTRDERRWKMEDGRRKTEGKGEG